MFRLCPRVTEQIWVVIQPEGAVARASSPPLKSLDSHFFDGRRTCVVGGNPQLELRPPGSRAGVLHSEPADEKRFGAVGPAREAIWSAEIF